MYEEVYQIPNESIMVQNTNATENTVLYLLVSGGP